VKQLYPAGWQRLPIGSEVVEAVEGTACLMRRCKESSNRFVFKTWRQIVDQYQFNFLRTAPWRDKPVKSNRGLSTPLPIKP
jgi:hypothetical protein